MVRSHHDAAPRILKHTVAAQVPYPPNARPLSHLAQVPVTEQTESHQTVTSTRQVPTKFGSTGECTTPAELLPGGHRPQKHDGPLRIIIPKGPSSLHTRILPAGIAAPLSESWGNPAQPGKTLPQDSSQRSALSREGTAWTPHKRPGPLFIEQGEVLEKILTHLPACAEGRQGPLAGPPSPPPVPAAVYCLDSPPRLWQTRVVLGQWPGCPASRAFPSGAAQEQIPITYYHPELHVRRSHWRI